jgi:hypothetical protein
MDIGGIDTKLSEEKRRQIREALHARAMAFQTKTSLPKGGESHKVHKPPSTQLGPKVKKLKSGGLTRRVRTGKIMR